MIFTSNSHIYFSKTFDRVWKLLFVLFAFATPSHFLCIFFAAVLCELLFSVCCDVPGELAFGLLSPDKCAEMSQTFVMPTKAGASVVWVCVCVRVCVWLSLRARSHMDILNEGPTISCPQTGVPTPPFPCPFPLPFPHTIISCQSIK